MQSLLTLKDAAKKLGISVHALKIRLSKGKFPEPTRRENGELYWAPEVIDVISYNDNQ